MKAKRTRLNGVAFVWDVVAGVMSDDDIAAKHGLGKAEVGGLRKGEGRPHLARWIRQWKAECQRNPSLHLALMKRAAVETMAKAMAGEASNTSLAAAKEFLNHTLGSRWIGQDGQAPQPAARPGLELELIGLPRRLKLRVLRALGGPLDLGDAPGDDDDDRDGRDDFDDEEDGPVGDHADEDRDGDYDGDGDDDGDDDGGDGRP
jgi:hypothetical protein